MKAVLVKSSIRRFEAFKSVLGKHGVETTVLDLDDPSWIDRDLAVYDFLLYFPDFAFSSNSPLAVAPVRDFVRHVHARFPRLEMFPDPEIIDFYNDKYPQYLFLRANGFPTPPTIPLVSDEALRAAERSFGYPLVLKNRHGAGGGAVYKIGKPRDLRALYRLSHLDLFHSAAALHFARKLLSWDFLYYMMKVRRMEYPFFSPPLIAQRLIQTDRDVRVVVGDGRVVEAHWRIQSSPEEWKVNIDGGGIGEWSAIPDKVTRLCTDVARKLGARWVAFDILKAGADDYLITEFSPVWHHYKRNEKPSFVYKDDYNIDVPLEVGLDLERLLVESLIARAKRKPGVRVG